MIRASADMPDRLILVKQIVTVWIINMIGSLSLLASLDFDLMSKDPIQGDRFSFVMLAGACIGATLAVLVPKQRHTMEKINYWVSKLVVSMLVSLVATPFAFHMFGLTSAPYLVLAVATTTSFFSKLVIRWTEAWFRDKANS